MADNNKPGNTSGQNKIVVKNLKKSFGSLEVLKDINMEVSEGEVVVLDAFLRQRKIHVPPMSESIGKSNGRTDHHRRA